MWINGKSYVDHSTSNFGTDSAVAMRWDFALDYTQNTTGGSTLTVYVDDPEAANGYIDP